MRKELPKVYIHTNTDAVTSGLLLTVSGHLNSKTKRNTK